MKKTLISILALVLLLSMFACGKTAPTEDTENIDAPADSESTENKATVTTNEGDTVEVSAQDLFNEYDGNEARFLKLYGGATIEFTGTVSYIKVGTDVYSGENVITNQHKTVFEEGWCLIIGSENATYDLVDYYPGQKLTVTTGIVSAAFDTEFLQTVADNNRVVWLVGNDNLLYDSFNTQTTKITVAE